MLIGDKRTPKVRRSVVVSFAAPPSLTCADLSGQACCKPCDGILAWMVCGAYLSWGQPGTAVRISTTCAVDDIGELSLPQRAALHQLSVERTIQSA